MISAVSVRPSQPRRLVLVCVSTLQQVVRRSTGGGKEPRTTELRQDDAPPAARAWQPSGGRGYRRATTVIMSLHSSKTSQEMPAAGATLARFVSEPWQSNAGRGGRSRGTSWCRAAARLLAARSRGMPGAICSRAAARQRRRPAAAHAAPAAAARAESTQRSHLVEPPHALVLHRLAQHVAHAGILDGPPADALRLQPRARQRQRVGRKLGDGGAAGRGCGTRARQAPHASVSRGSETGSSGWPRRRTAAERGAGTPQQCVVRPPPTCTCPPPGSCGLVGRPRTAARVATESGVLTWTQPKAHRQARSDSHDVAPCSSKRQLKREGRLEAAAGTAPVAHLAQQQLTAQGRCCPPPPASSPNLQRHAGYTQPNSTSSAPRPAAAP